MEQDNQNKKESAQQKQPAKQHRPENKDNLDSRENEEQDVKGDDHTNNKKDSKKGKGKMNK